jgi:hypothetical protein
VTQCPGFVQPHLTISTCVLFVSQNAAAHLARWPDFRTQHGYHMGQNWPLHHRQHALLNCSDEYKINFHLTFNSITLNADISSKFQLPPCGNFKHAGWQMLYWTLCGNFKHAGWQCSTEHSQQKWSVSVLLPAPASIVPSTTVVHCTFHKTLQLTKGYKPIAVAMRGARTAQ